MITDTGQPNNLWLTFLRLKKYGINSPMKSRQGCCGLTLIRNMYIIYTAFLFILDAAFLLATIFSNDHYFLFFLHLDIFSLWFHPLVSLFLGFLLPIGIHSVTFFSWLSIHYTYMNIWCSLDSPLLELQFCCFHLVLVLLP